MSEVNVSQYKFKEKTVTVDPETLEELEEISSKDISFNSLQGIESHLKRIKTYNDRQLKLFKQGHIENLKFRLLITN